MEAATTIKRLTALSEEFASERRARQHRRELVEEDFERIRNAGFLLSVVPTEMGGTWENPARSARPVCEMLRSLARGDSSVALACAMHPAVIGFWLATPEAASPYRDAWKAQRDMVFRSSADGAWWGTLISEPGTGGDHSKTRAIARPDESDSRRYVLSGIKQLGSGSGITSYMLTIARPDGEEAPDLFFLKVANTSWDGSTGMKIIAPWDGHGMIASQSHGFRFEDFPAERFAFPATAAEAGSTWARPQPLARSYFTSVFIGILDAALQTARESLAKRPRLTPFEEVEWTRAEQEGWLATQAYEGILREIESGRDANRVAVQGKLATAELAESVMTRLCRIFGGATFARSSPFGHWAQDVRTLGFLRPPWSLSYDILLEGSLEGDGTSRGLGGQTT
jgi:alkylation response protein AidB-like acyl-CoA dehydrogenase